MGHRMLPIASIPRKSRFGYLHVGLNVYVCMVLHCRILIQLTV